MRTGISITLKPADRRHLVTPREIAVHRMPSMVWRGEIVLLSAVGVGTNEMHAPDRQVGKTCVWRWQERFSGGRLRRPAAHG